MGNAAPDFWGIVVARDGAPGSVVVASPAISVMNRTRGRYSEVGRVSVHTRTI